MPFAYLAIDVAAICVPLAFSFHRKIRFDRMLSSFGPAMIVVATVFIAWDRWFVSRGVWGFNPDFLTGISLFGLPVEEVLFFICIPYACVFTYHCFGVLNVRSPGRKMQRLISMVLMCGLAVAALWNSGRAYTALTFGSLSLVLAVLEFVIVPSWLGRFYVSYLALLVPFFIVNGLLTGQVFGSPVVWYDNSENLGWRLLSIPVEDVFYGMLLILLNVAVMEWVRGRLEEWRHRLGARSQTWRRV